MTPPMHQRVKNLFVDAGLTTGYKVQSLIWDDSGKLADRFIVFRPNGGTDVDRDVSSDYYVLVDVITGKNIGDAAKGEVDVQSIIDFIKNLPLPDPCAGAIRNMGGTPSPISTTEGRLVWRLQFACTYGE